MARYGREWYSPRRYRGRRAGGERGGWEMERRGYGPEYGVEPGMPYYGREYAMEPGMPRRRRRRAAMEYGPRMGYAEEMGYGERMGFEEEAGYGAEMPYYGMEYAPEYGRDYEFGGRGWPYREGYGMERGFERREAMRRAGYGREMRGAPGYARRGPEAYRPARGVAPVTRRYEGAEAGGRFGERGMETRREAVGEEIDERALEQRFHFGHTPPDRWPSAGHDVDHRPRRELQMDDGEIREAVLENLFQDTWIDPERIEVEVEDGVVTLAGEVNDFMEARYAWDDAWESAGVRGVVNNLTVRVDKPQEDLDIPQTAGSRRKQVQRHRVAR